MSKSRFVISKNVVLEKYEECRKISDIVSYSSKTNPLISTILEENTDTFFSIHFINELKNVKDMKRVYFLAQGLSNDTIAILLEKGVDKFVLDNEYDLDLMLNYILDHDVKIDTLLLRYRLKERSIRTEKYFVFGMNSDVVKRRISEIRESPKLNDAIANLGMHFHRKTQNMAEWNLKFELTDTFEPQFFKSIDIINIGGGLPSSYANTNVDVIDSIKKKINDLKNLFNGYNVKMIVEPGRFIAAPSGQLEAYVVGLYDNNIIVNTSVYSGDLDALVVPVKLKVKGEFSYEQAKMINQDEDMEVIKAYVIKGVTPCSMDLYRYKVYLNEVKVGDKIVFLNAGAYNFSSDFCDLDVIESVIID
jgi:ornithine decarboxylase